MINTRHGLIAAYKNRDFFAGYKTRAYYAPRYRRRRSERFRKRRKKILFHVLVYEKEF